MLVVSRCRYLVAAMLFSFNVVAHAHFQEVIPSQSSVTQDGPRDVTVDLCFTHPMAGGPVMEMAKPVRFGVMVRGQQIDLLESLAPVKRQDKTAYRSQYQVAQPGAHTFFVEPAPYFESGESTWIIHYTKVCVDAFGSTGGWKDLVGFPVEIRPLTRPMGLWTGNTFRGEVLQDGKPVPYATVEVEYRNEDGSIEPPSSAFETQSLLTDANGTFSYTAPRAGWWGFAALIVGEDRPAPDGEPAGVELGALVWLNFVDME